MKVRRSWCLPAPCVPGSGDVLRWQLQLGGLSPGLQLPPVITEAPPLPPPMEECRKVLGTSHLLSVLLTTRTVVNSPSSKPSPTPKPVDSAFSFPLCLTDTDSAYLSSDRQNWYSYPPQLRKGASGNPEESFKGSKQRSLLCCWALAFQLHTSLVLSANE